MTHCTTAQAYKHCQKLTSSHYENFPVASILLPARLRKPISAIYAFARMADDFADEGNLSVTERYKLLDSAKHNLLKAADNKPDDNPVYIALADTLEHHPALLPQLLNLLTAFNQDVEKDRYASFGEVMTYCRNSANPVGHMLLILFNEDNEKNVACSDAVCSALQIINFLQDIQSDYCQRNRIYMPADEMQQYQITTDNFDKNSPPHKLTNFMNFQVQRTLKLLQAGAPLGFALKGRVGFELRMIILGGWLILKKINDNQGDINNPPKLDKKDWLWVFLHAFSSRFIIYLKNLLPISTS
ncbi:MAG: squalene synthase HpnC [Gammaproteobacteria bacterium]|nr:squalene synthase HpnC [Gammaproteobacteria bacterium]